MPIFWSYLVMTAFAFVFAVPMAKWLGLSGSLLGLPLIADSVSGYRRRRPVREIKSRREGLGSRIAIFCRSRVRINVKFLAKNMDGLSRDAGLEISDLRVAAVLIFVILNLAVFLLRLVSVWRYGALFGPDSSLAIYPVWKGVHHLPIYEWPLAYPFSPALYNFVFKTPMHSS